MEVGSLSVQQFWGGRDRIIFVGKLVFHLGLEEILIGFVIVECFRIDSSYFISDLNFYGPMVRSKVREALYGVDVYAGVVESNVEDVRSAFLLRLIICRPWRRQYLNTVLGGETVEPLTSPIERPTPPGGVFRIKLTTRDGEFMIKISFKHFYL